MIFGYLTLFTALIISLSAAVYSILGLTAIFAAAFWPIVIMGGSLEFGKIVTTLWLHKYWDRAEIQYKVYLCSAVAILMLLTSMGVFGFLSKAHTDQGLVSGDVTSKIAIYDEKIKIERDNIDANRRALKQMDEAVDQVMARSTTETGADKSVAIRRSQQKERSRLLSEIAESQKKITTLNEQRAPIAAEVRKVEAEVGPIKYIAALVYGDNPEANVLEKAVRWVIILIVIVFDPLALTLLLAATKALEWERGINIFAPKKKQDEESKYEPDDGPLTDEQLDQIRKTAQDDVPVGIVTRGVTGVLRQAVKPEEFFDRAHKTAQAIDDGTYQPPVDKQTILDGLDHMWAQSEKTTIQDPESEHAPVETTENTPVETTENTPVEAPEHHDDEVDSVEKQAMRAWKEKHPNETIKKYRTLHHAGYIKEVPWKHPDYHPDYATQSELQADNDPVGSASEVKGFGTNFPAQANKGDMFLRVDSMPSILYKFNGTNWIAVDKNLSENYAYDKAYIDHLINKISTGEYDLDLLSDAERSSIEQQLKQNSKE